MSRRQIASITFALFTAFSPMTPLPALARLDRKSISSPLPLSALWPAGGDPMIGLTGPVNVCYATPNSGGTVFGSPDSAAIRQALGAASLGDIVKVAGYCAGLASQGDTNQLALITQTLTLAGGYTRRTGRALTRLPSRPRLTASMPGGLYWSTPLQPFRT